MKFLDTFNSIKRSVLAFLACVPLLNGCATLPDSPDLNTSPVVATKAIAQTSAATTENPDDADTVVTPGDLNGQRLHDLFNLSSANPQILVIYNDTTRSRSQTGSRGSWEDIWRVTTHFITTAPANSVLEIYDTGPHAGQPHLVMRYTAQSLTRRQKQTEAMQAFAQMQSYVKQLEEHPRYFSGSYIVEDIHRCAMRAAALGDSAAARQILVHSDLQQFSPLVTKESILRDKEKVVSDATSNSSAMVERVLRALPPLKKASRFTIAYYPGQPNKNSLNDSQEERLKLFFNEIITAWDCPPCRFTEPQNLVASRIR